MTDISVLVPTWRRPDVLLRCVRALQVQTLPPTQVVVTVRHDDELTWRALEKFDARALSLVPVSVEAGPVTAAMAAGLGRTSGEIVAITDDDAEPRPDWLARMAAHFADPSVGGVGGRDHQAGAERGVPTVGRVQWAGRVIGNHHVGSGPARDVELLKGVNCSFRGDELRRIRFDDRLRGRGNVSHWEMSLCFAFRRAGWRLIYDPAIGVDHHVATRHDGDTNARGGFEAQSFTDAVHNETFALLRYLRPANRAAFLVWAAAVGTGESPGLAQVARLLARRSPHVAARWRATVRGRAAGVRTYLASQDGTNEGTA